MSEYVKCEQSETKSDSGCETDDLESFIHTSIRVEYYWTFEHCWKWKRPMYRRQSSRLQKAAKRSPERSSSPNEVIQRKLRGKRRGAGLRKVKESDSTVITSDEEKRDIIDIIDSSRDVTYVSEEEEVMFVEAADKGVDKSDDDSASVTSSIASGPSHLHHATPKKLKPSQALCSACWKLYQKAKKMKSQIKNKLLDNDPKSLTCDQWVLIKKVRQRRVPNTEGKLLMHVQLVKKRLKVKNKAKRGEGEEESTTCLRPHIFLQRNLRRCVRVPVKREMKKNRRKRKRDYSQSPRATKQKRLHSNNRLQHITNNGHHPTSGHTSSPSLGVSTEQETDSPDADLTVELIPCTVSLENIKPREASPNKKSPKKRGGFRDLLAQLRGNSSMVVRETH